MKEKQPIRFYHQGGTLRNKRKVVELSEAEKLKRERRNVRRRAKATARLNLLLPAKQVARLTLKTSRWKKAHDKLTKAAA